MGTVPFRRNVWTSASLHGTLIGAFLLTAVIHGCVANKHPKEIVTIIDLQAPAFDVPPVPVPTPPEPTPPEPTPPVPMPPTPKPPEPKPPVPKPPVPKPPAPKPPEPTPPKPPIHVNTNRVVHRPPSTPATPPRPQLTKAQIEALLKSGLPVSTTGSSSVPPDAFPFGWYLALVKQKMYDAWQQPGGLSMSDGLFTRVEVEIARDGSVLKKNIVGPSGNSIMDASVQKALDGVSSLPPLPDSYKGRTREITIDFRLTGGT